MAHIDPRAMMQHEDATRLAQLDARALMAAGDATRASNIDPLALFDDEATRHDAGHDPDGLRINGVPEYWEAVPGGYLAQWDAPTLVRERGDQLAVAWTGAGDDWFDSHAVVDDGLVIGLGRGSAAVVRLALTSGREQWRAPSRRWPAAAPTDPRRGRPSPSTGGRSRAAAGGASTRCWKMSL